MSGPQANFLSTESVGVDAEFQCIRRLVFLWYIKNTPISSRRQIVVLFEIPLCLSGIRMTMVGKYQAFTASILNGMWSLHLRWYSFVYGAASRDS